MSSCANIVEGLRDHLRRLAGLERSYELMILNFSRLMPYYRQGKFMTAARCYIEDRYAVQGKVAFTLPNLDIVLVYETPEDAHRENLFFHLRELLAFDPLMNTQTFGKVDGLFLQVFDLTNQNAAALAELENLGQTMLAFEEQSKKRRSAKESTVVDHDSTATYVNPSDGTVASTTARNPAAEVKRVSALADRYRNLDIASVLRRELVIRHDPNSVQQFVFAFSQLDPSMLKLMTYRDQRVDADDALMNRYLAHVLQFRLLDYLIKHEDSRLRRDVALPVHPELILDPRFTRFEELLLKGGQCRVILQFTLADIYSDYRLFYFVRQHLRQRGYRLALGDVRYELLETVDLDALGLDFLFLRADADWSFLATGEQTTIISEIAEIGAEKIVLTNCVQERIFNFALKSGIKLLCGDTIRGRFDRSRSGQGFRESESAESLLLGEGMRQRSRA